MFKIIEKEMVINLEEKDLPPYWSQRYSSEKPFKENNYFKNTQISQGLWISGNDKLLIKELIYSIDNAKEMVCISSYIFNESQIYSSIINASKRGIRVYLITASHKFLKNLPYEDDDFNARMFDQMSEFFTGLQKIIKIRTSEDFHTKFILIDPLKEKLRKGYLLTCNIDTKGIVGVNIEGKLRVNPEICISLNDKEIKQFFNQFCYAFWELSTEESKIDGFYPIKHNIKKKYHLKNAIFNCKTHNNLLKSILNILDSTNGDIIICTYGITRENQIYEKILKKIKKGRNLTLLTRPRPKNMNALIELSENGATVIGHNDIHAKLIISDKNGKYQGIVMTANIEKGHFENMLESGKLLSENELTGILKIIDKWTENFPLELNTGKKRGDIKKQDEILIWNKEKEEIIPTKIFETKELKLKEGPFQGESINNYEHFELTRQNIKIPDEYGNLYIKVINKYDVIPPILPNTARKIKSTSEEPTLYSYKNKKYIIAKDFKEFNKYIEYAKKSDAKIVTLNKFIE